MADKNIFKLEGKSQEQVKEAFLEFLKIDKTKPGGYASVGSNKVICKVAKEACGVNSVLEIKKAEDATEVSKLLATVSCSIFLIRWRSLYIAGILRRI